MTLSSPTAVPASQKPLCLALLGPTASGKSEFALELAERLGGEILCLDSTTVYKGFNIGSAKPSPSQQKRVPHHLLDILDPTEDFSAGKFMDLAQAKIDEVVSRGKIPFVVGGTYFYLRALQFGMNPVPSIAEEIVDEIEQQYATEEEGIDTVKMHADLVKADAKAAQNIHVNDKYRIARALAVIKATGKKLSELEPVHKEPAHANRIWMKYSMAISRHTLSAQIVSRTDAMIAQGLVEETRLLTEKYPKARALGAIGYHEAGCYLRKELDDKGLRNGIIEKTRQLAKRQLTWIRSDAEIRFVDSRDGDRVAKEVENLTFVLKENA